MYCLESKFTQTRGETVGQRSSQSLVGFPGHAPGAFQEPGRERGREEISSCQDTRSPGPLLAMIQLCFYLIYMLKFSCQISLLKRVCGEGTERKPMIFKV